MAMCPILSALNNKNDDGKDQWECFADTCAWFINGKCAVVVIAEALNKD